MVGTAKHFLKIWQFGDQFLEQRDRGALRGAQFPDCSLPALYLQHSPERVGRPLSQQPPSKWSLCVVEDPEQSVLLLLVLLGSVTIIGSWSILYLRIQVGKSGIPKIISMK